MVMESVKVQDARGRWTAGDLIHELSDREKSCDYSLEITKSTNFGYSS